MPGRRGFRPVGRVNGDDWPLAVERTGEHGPFDRVPAERPQHRVQLVGPLVGELRVAAKHQNDRPAAGVGRG